MERGSISLLINSQKPAILLAFVFMTMSCQTNTVQTNSNCITEAQGYSTQKPCWLFKHDEKYIKIQGNKHIGSNGWLKTKQILFKEAILEIATRRYGEDVAIKTLIVKEVRDNQGNTSSQSKVVREAHFNSGDKTINIKAQIIDYYYDTNVEKVWVLVKEL